MSKAIVIGGGIAGLSAAQVLSQYYSNVEIYDSGSVSQGHHLHVLMKAGQVILEDLFPGILDECKKRDCPEIDWAKDTLWENSHGTFPQYTSGLTTVSMSRPLLQELMISKLNKNIVIHSTLVSSLDQISASLIVIAGGQNFPLNKYIPGVVRSSQDINIGLTYRSFVVKTSDLHLNGFKQYYFQIDPPYTLIGGVISPFEDAKSIITIIEKEKSLSKCTNFQSFLSKSKKIPSGRFYNIIKNSTPIQEMATFRKNDSQKKILNYKIIPTNVIIMGDVLASLNPVFGQGMSLSLKQAQLLQSMLTNKKFNTKDFHKESLKTLRTPYTLSKIGSEEKTILKNVLGLYLKCCQNFRFLHTLFIHQLHSLRIIPEKIK